MGKSPLSTDFIKKNVKQYEDEEGHRYLLDRYYVNEDRLIAVYSQSKTHEDFLLTADVPEWLNVDPFQWSQLWSADVLTKWIPVKAVNVAFAQFQNLVPLADIEYLMLLA